MGMQVQGNELQADEVKEMATEGRDPVMAGVSGRSAERVGESKGSTGDDSGGPTSKQRENRSMKTRMDKVHQCYNSPVTVVRKT